ncbi:MAG: hypothetical protein NC112_07660 [Oxalobacter formigenes]|nr:hypothetical protein [Oxalobacter formigenes]
MDAKTFQSKYRIDLGTTYLIRRTHPQVPLHYHFSDGYNHDVIKRNSTERELRHMAETIARLNKHSPDTIEEVLADLLQLRQNLYSPYKTAAMV